MPFFSTFTGSFSTGRRKKHGNQDAFASLAHNPFRDEDVVLHLLPGSDQEFANGSKTVPDVYDNFSKARFSSASLVMWCAGVSGSTTNTLAWTYDINSDVHYDGESIDSTTDGAFFASSNAHTHRAVNGVGASIDLTGENRLQIKTINSSSSADVGTDVDLTTYNNDVSGATHGTAIHTWEPLTDANEPIWWYSHNSSALNAAGTANPLNMGNSTYRSSTDYQNGDGWFGDFTIEGWIQVWANTTEDTVVYTDQHSHNENSEKFSLTFITDTANNDVGYWRVQFGTGTTDYKIFREPNYATTYTHESDPDQKPWIHFAITRTNNQYNQSMIRFFHNGEQWKTTGGATGNNGYEWVYGGNVCPSSNFLTFGEGDSSYKLEGFRIVNGSALYTKKFIANKNLAREKTTASLSYDYNGIVQPANNLVHANGTPLWTPVDEGNTGLWIDAMDTSSWTDNGSSYPKLSTVTDKAGNATITVGGTPSISTAMGGKTVFSFEPTNNDDLTTNHFLGQVSSGNHWAVGVFMWDGVDDTKDSLWSVENTIVNASVAKRDYAVSAGSSTVSAGFTGELDLDNLGYYRISDSQGNKIDWDNLSLNRQWWYIISVIFNYTGNQIAVRVMGDNAFTPVNDYDNPLTPELMTRIMRNRGNERMQGSMAEFFTVADIPGTGGTDISKVEKAEGYLAHKWHSSNLEKNNLLGRLNANHPYKNSAP